MFKGSVFLHSFTPVIPRFQGEQADLVDWIIEKHTESKWLAGEEAGSRFQNLLKRFTVNSTQISNRFFDTNREDIYLLRQDKLSGADIMERNLFFGKRVLEVFEEIYAKERCPRHLIHVTCTGYLSPSAPQVYFGSKTDAPEITHAYHMGCYASLPAVRMGQALVSSQGQLVDVVHNEICSLHLNPAQHSPEQMVVQTLFADGHIKYSLSEDRSGRRFEIKSIKERIIPNSENDMTWVPSAVGMQMTLSKEVPEKIRDHLIDFIRDLASDNHVEVDELIRTSLFAIHPGGPKIIEGIEKRLELSPSQTVDCRNVMQTRGNMSSATLPHIWKEIYDSKYQGRIISLAFGPGLTIFGSLFEVKS